MMQLEFEVTNQFINRIDTKKPVADSKNYLYAHFNFLTQEWLNKAVNALFTKNDVSYIMLLGTNNECLVPWELITEKGDIYVSVYSGNLSTTNKSRITVYDSGYTDITENSEPPTPEIHQQFIDGVTQARNDVVNLRNDLLILDGGTTDSWSN